MTQKIQDIEDALTDYRDWTRVRDKLARCKPDFALSLEFHAFGAHFGKAKITHRSATTLAEQELNRASKELAALGIDIDA
jgi:hypothetical protein